MKTNPFCSFCHLQPANVEAHIIPRSFIKHYSADGQPNFILSNSMAFSKKTWTGVWDDALVCRECESKFGALDDYGYQFFHAEQIIPIFVDGEEFLWQHVTADAVKLKLFILSILWRASASNRPELRQVDLGRWEPEIARMIESGDPGDVDRFPIVLERFVAPPGATPIFYPYKLKIAGARCYKLELAGCTAVMALHGREWPSELIDIALTRDRPVYLLAKIYAGSHEHRRLLEIAKTYYAKNGRLPGKHSGGPTRPRKM